MIQNLFRHCGPAPYQIHWRRGIETCTHLEKKGLVLGFYEGCCPGEFKLTKTAAKFDESVEGKLTVLLKGQKLKRHKALVFGNVGNEFNHVAVTSLGQESAGENPAEALEECRENIREAAGRGTIALQDQGVTKISVEEFTNAEAAGEAAGLAVWSYQEWKKKEDRQLTDARVELYGSDDSDGWKRGIVKANAQNVARGIQQTPANLMTPILFARFAAELLCPCGVKVDFMDRNWMEQMRFSALLTVAKGSCEPPSMLIIQYTGADLDQAPIVFTGKHATYDSGGLSAGRDDKKMAKSGISAAAVTIGVFKAVAQMSLPINLIAVIALYENLISGMSIKPGDVVVARNGKTILVEDTAMSGRLVMADVLTYVNDYQPCLVVNMASSSASLAPSIGYPPTGVFSTSDILWEELNLAGLITGDRFWRFPLWKFFRSKVTSYEGVDVSNNGHGLGKPCMLPAFLLEFAPSCVDLLHLDITSSSGVSKGIGMPYLRKGLMSGRPTRPLVQFLYRVACPHEPTTATC